ncbi:MAG: hypothetical protein ABJA67_13460 [Chthonomonadales bacterium]
MIKIESLMDALPGTPEEDELDVLATLAYSYEKRTYPILPPEPIEALKYHIESRGLTTL